MESISNEKIKLKEGNTYFFICYALVCGGKSTFFEQILSQTSTEENKSKYNVIMVSSDQIRSDLSKEMQKKNPGMTFKQCFDKLSRETAREFDTQIFQAIKKRDKSKINIILVDKNYPQGINQFVKKFCKYQSTQFFIVFIPNLSQGIKINELYHIFGSLFFSIIIINDYSIHLSIIATTKFCEYRIKRTLLKYFCSFYYMPPRHGRASVPLVNETSYEGTGMTTFQNETSTALDVITNNPKDKELVAIYKNGIL